VLLTTQAFPPEILPAAVMADELAEGLVRRGFDVAVAAGLPHHHMSALPDGYERKLRSVAWRKGYRVVRVWHPLSWRTSLVARACVMIAQTVATVIAAATAGRPDVVISFGGPPLLGPVLSGALAAAWRVPMISVIHDIYPDVAKETKSVSNPIVLGIANLLEMIQYRLSWSLVVLSDVIRDVVVSKKIDSSKVHVLPVWLDPNEIKPLEHNNAWRREMGIGPDEFVVLYAGTAGIISGAEVLADVARLLPADVIILVVGGGKAWCELKATTMAGDAPRNLRVVPFQPRERLSEVQSAADLSVLTLRPGRGRTSVPSKLQGYMAAGRPVLAAVDGKSDAAMLVERRGFGEVVPLNAEAMANAILAARAEPARLEAWGKTARHVFVGNYAKEPLIDRYASLIRTALGAERASLHQGPSR
jgi:colanic acid biosynthesis glycosyl transferase WcaI